MSKAGDALKRLRKDRMLSQSAIAKILGHKSPQAVSNTERGIAPISKYWLKPLKKHLKLTKPEVESLVDAIMTDISNEYQKYSGLRE